MTQKRGLGRGLGALIPTSPTTPAEPVVDVRDEAGNDDWISNKQHLDFREVPVESVRPNPRQPRQVFEEEGKLKVVFYGGAYGVAPGQSAVFYEGEDVIGGGIIYSGNDTFG